MSYFAVLCRTFLLQVRYFPLDLITKLLIEIIEYYINEYLFEEEHVSRNDTLNIENQFKKAIEEQNYLKYFIKAYTLTNSFHHILNKHLALYLLEYSLDCKEGHMKKIVCVCVCLHRGQKNIFFEKPIFFASDGRKSVFRVKNGFFKFSIFES